MDAPFNISLLNNNWIHSFEEDSGSEMTFRPSSFPFPPSRRSRTSLNLKSDGSLTVGGNGPDDRRTERPARWKVDHNTIMINDTDSDLKRMKILSLDKDKLVLTTDDNK